MLNYQEETEWCPRMCVDVYAYMDGYIHMTSPNTCDDRECGAKKAALCLMDTHRETPLPEAKPCKNSIQSPHTHTSIYVHMHTHCQKKEKKQTHMHSVMSMHDAFYFVNAHVSSVSYPALLLALTLDGSPASCF